MTGLIEAFLGSPVRRDERRRRKAWTKYCRTKFGKHSRAYRRALRAYHGM